MRCFMQFFLVGALTCLLLSGCVSIQSISDKSKPAEIEQNNKVVLASEIEWQALNPARGNKSPLAANLWGDRNNEVATGFLVKFVDGFSSPPHIHNTTYRAVVISGLIHNDDPDAAPMWMPKGSFWTQPKGEIHITAAQGNHNVALVEIDKGPYLVMPSDNAFDSGARPINVDVSNLIWLDLPSDSSSTSGVKIAYLWGNMDNGSFNGSFLRLSSGFNFNISTQASIFHAVVISGNTIYHQIKPKELTPGSYFGSNGNSLHKLSSGSTEETVIYIRTNGNFSVRHSD